MEFYIALTEMKVVTAAKLLKSTGLQNLFVIYDGVSSLGSTKEVSHNVKDL